MGQSYEQLSLEERCESARRREAGASIRKIAAALDRSPSSISRELKRNDASGRGCKPVFAGDQAWARRWRSSRLERAGDQQRVVGGRLRVGWSPEQVAGRFAREAGEKVISHESIYRFI